jgi:hypothetical protein
MLTKLDKYKAQLLILLGCVALYISQTSLNALICVGAIVVAGAALGTGYYYWGHPRPPRYYWDEVNQEYCYGYHARDLAKDLLLRLWNRVKVPLKVAFVGLLYVAFVLVLIYL